MFDIARYYSNSSLVSHPVSDLWEYDSDFSVGDSSETAIMNGAGSPLGQSPLQQRGSLEVENPREFAQLVLDQAEWLAEKQQFLDGIQARIDDKMPRTERDLVERLRLNEAQKRLNVLDDQVRRAQSDLRTLFANFKRDSRVPNAERPRARQSVDTDDMVRYARSLMSSSVDVDLFPELTHVKTS